MSLDRRILIADDDLEIRQGVRELLSGLGLEFLEAENGSEALAIVRRGDIQLALLDNQMPGATGLEILQVIHAEILRVPCIVCSGDSFESLERMARAAGAIAVLRKPVEPLILRTEVVRALALSNGSDSKRPSA